MNNLINIIEKLRERIQKYGELLRKSEAQTRYVLIDPLLRAIGWDTEDPEKVRVEDRPRRRGQPDYVLYVRDRRLVAIEAKSLETRIDEVAVGAGLKYSFRNRIPYFVITNGSVWSVYNVRERKGAMIFRLIFSIDISKDKPEDIVEKLSTLKYEHVVKKRRIEVVRRRKQPLIKLDEDKVREFYNSLTPSERALLEVVYEAWKRKRVLKKDDIIEELRKRGIKIDRVSFTGVKSGITRLAKKHGLYPPIPSEKELGKEYRKEENRYRLRDEWGRVLEKILG